MFVETLTKYNRLSWPIEVKVKGSPVPRAGSPWGEGSIDLLSKFSRKISRIGYKTLLMSSSVTQCNVCAIASRGAEHCARSPPQHAVASKYITAM